MPFTDAAPDLYSAEPIPAEARAEIDRILQSGDLFRYNAAATSPVALLERDFAERLGCRFALAVTSCSSALFLAMKALELPLGARVLVPAFTFAAVPSSVIHAGCIPVLVECGADLRIDMDDFSSKLDDADAVLISHMRGHTSDMDQIMALAATRGLPVIEDAAHSLGTKWNEKNIGTIGRIGCFSFQSYKLMNGGEGGMLVTDDAQLIARAVIMSGAYEHNWRKHDLIAAEAEKLQNCLPLYNMRMNNLSAAVLRPQLKELDRRILDGRHNHDYVAALLNTSPWLSVPAPLPPELRAPDSIQFALTGMSDAQMLTFADAANVRGIPAQIFGRSENNARAFWNWNFLPEKYDLPKTRDMLLSTCDVRLPARLTPRELDAIARILLDAALLAGQGRAYGT
ncbi:DegT/DnrJ/EryC1/StrS family aminotransferase [Qingshengfaniella alkalisoli]|uniref:Aminotransferase class I/II-fold pyridoxal phosphate-dependent enzyme n=1 Tax=Qingshengfaniella alkalisoli TaxID=2599296 RepID=A0A5B8IY65_9RHOB|nr:aminotransferase class I/II-fold pyridoxal phosphate-dependent enzyme [Qingshengfaniella alkalisoli]QDY69598.1 aminotransferase class I/II-fold pyridoxal phosphate-dependent enzyme [Qingshengfaniella alkalisoli]